VGRKAHPLCLYWGPMTLKPVDKPVPWKRERRRRKIIVAAPAVLLVLAFGFVTARLFVWPELTQLPAQADAIVELGGPGDRDSEALALAREYRPRFLIRSSFLVRPAALSTACFPPMEGVTVLCIHAEPRTTRGEAEYIRRLAAEYHWRSVILVTTPDQAWRARLWVTRCFDGDVYVSTTGLPLSGWLRQIPYQWGATVKALTVERTC
jgi:uncharacterized SAM-binding protein YcdF (DUF218 family)